MLKALSARLSARVPGHRRTPSVAAAMLLTVGALAGCGEEDSTGAASSSTNCDYPQSGEPAKEVEAPPASADDAPTTATIRLGAGEITLTLRPEQTPCTVASFASLVEQGWYDGTDCHRLTTDGIFVLQCGDPTGSGYGGPGYTIPDEVDGTETYPAGTLAMAKTNAPDSGGSQFFLVYDDSPLDPDYTVFGSFDDAGVELLRDIAAGGTADGSTSGPPASEATIESISLG